jgi:hypothetical protein
MRKITEPVVTPAVYFLYVVIEDSYVNIQMIHVGIMRKKI